MRKDIFILPVMLLLFASVSNSENLLPIGTLRTTEHLIIIHYGKNGTFYTVKTHEGKVLENQINKQELISKMPYLEDVLERGIADDASTHRRYMRDKGLRDNNSWDDINDY